MAYQTVVLVDGSNRLLLVDGASRLLLVSSTGSDGSTPGRVSITIAAPSITITILGGDAVTGIITAGTTLRARFQFTDADGVATDPTTVSAKVVNPLGTSITYVYGTDSELTKNGTGDYYLAAEVLTHQGPWRIQPEGTGACDVVSWVEIPVRGAI